MSLPVSIQLIFKAHKHRSSGVIHVEVDIELPGKLEPAIPTLAKALDTSLKFTLEKFGVIVDTQLTELNEQELEALGELSIEELFNKSKVN
jgi:hypothetical protein